MVSPNGTLPRIPQFKEMRTGVGKCLFVRAAKNRCMVGCLCIKFWFVVDFRLVKIEEGFQDRPSFTLSPVRGYYWGEVFTRIRNSIQFRMKMARFGIFYLRGFRLTSIRAGGRRIQLHLPPRERAEHEWEFGQILFDDCYHLAQIPAPARTIVDIGANIGVFALAARYYHPEARIYSYEPNPELEPYLAAHCKAIGSEYSLVAVGDKTTRIKLNPGVDSRHGISEESAGGDIPQIAFADIVKEVGPIDLLKLDCEGAEWGIFADPKPWEQVRNVAMEYHFFAKPGAMEEDLRRQLQQLGFTRIEIKPSPKGGFGFAWAGKP